MSEQFLNLEGRDTFDADNSYEKVKIINGGIPQNSDLNEQSSIDEDRSRNIIKEGFGSGKLNRTDFTLELDTGILSLLERTEETGVIGTLWQDGYRLKLRGADTVIANGIDTPLYRRLKATGAFKGRVYLVHAKQDYLDPNDRLTVRDINDVNLIQIDTAIREKRIVDYYIDWGADNDPAPDRIDSNNPVLLDDTGIFSGKESFADSPLAGFTGYLYYLGDITQVDGGEQSLNQETSERFDGNADNALYTGGDDAHRRDTEVSGLVYRGAGTPTYDGLKASDPSSVGSFHTGISIGTWTYEVALPKIDIKKTQGTNFEQLHIPSKGYDVLGSDLTAQELVENILVDTYGTVQAAIEAVMASFGFPNLITGANEGDVSAFLLLYVDDTHVGLDNPNSYHLDLDPDSIAPTASKFPIALIRLVLDSVSVLQLTFRLEYNSISYLYDRRRYFVNAEGKVAEAPTTQFANMDRYVLRTVGSAGIGTNDSVSISGTIFTVVSFDEPSQLLVLDYVSGTGAPSAGLAISYNNGGGWTTSGSIAQILVHPNNNPIVEELDKDLSARGTSTLPHQTVSELDGTTVKTKPRTVSSSLAQIRGILGQLLPIASNRYPYAQWFDLLKKGMRIQSIQTYLNGLQQIVWGLIAPSAPLSTAGIKIVNFTLSGKTNREGLIMLVDGTRTLRDDDGGVAPVIRLQGTSVDGVNFAPFIHLIHTGNTGEDIGKWGGMIVLEGKNGIIACPKGANFRNVYAGDTGVIIDGQTGNIIATLATIATGTILALTVFDITQVIGTASFSGNVVINPSIGKTLKIQDGVAVSSSFTGTFINNLITGILNIVNSFTVGIGGVGNKGKVKLDCANTGTPDSLLTIQNDIGASVTIKMSRLKEIFGQDGEGSNPVETSLHSHPVGSVLYNTPVGTIIASGVIPVDDGGIKKLAIGSPYLYCNGQAIGRTTWDTLFSAISDKYGVGNGSTTFNAPNLMGEFLRGVNDSSGNDPDVATRTPHGTNLADDAGSAQTNQFGSHRHTYNNEVTNLTVEDGTGATVADDAEVAQNTGYAGGNETRPRNVYVYYYIKAILG